jgi:hypothetical protein
MILKFLKGYLKKLKKITQLMKIFKFQREKRKPVSQLLL